MIKDFEETAIYHQLASAMTEYNNSEKLVIAILKCIDFIKEFLSDEDLRMTVAIPSRMDHGCRLRLFIAGRRIDLLFGCDYTFYYSDIDDHFSMFAFKDAPPYSSFHDDIMKDLELFRGKCSKCGHSLENKNGN